uniref:Uncharacterized protein n=1 Tax=Plectus sambesii TaxID=2011161 RepID=A0A914XAG3_9BILA
MTSASASRAGPNTQSGLFCRCRSSRPDGRTHGHPLAAVHSTRIADGQGDVIHAPASSTVHIPAFLADRGRLCPRACVPLPPSPLVTPTELVKLAPVADTKAPDGPNSSEWTRPAAVRPPQHPAMAVAT